MNKWTKFFKLTVRRKFGVLMVKVLNTLGCNIQSLWPIYTDFIFDDDILDYLHLEFFCQIFHDRNNSFIVQIWNTTFPFLFKYEILQFVYCSKLNWITIFF